jgi:hypothetical protein
MRQRGSDVFGFEGSQFFVGQDVLEPLKQFW